MRPKISSYYPFDYEKVLKESMYAFTAKGKVMLVTDELYTACLRGYIIDIYNDGVYVNGTFFMNKGAVNTETLTININQFICDWLINQDELDLVNYD
jgi:hypothetical protein